MIRSMTGFGEAAGEYDGAHYFLELRSINNRYFKPVIRLPEELQGLEAELDSALRKRISRGTVTLTARCSDTSESAAHEVNYRALDRYLEQIRKSEQTQKTGASIDVAALLHLPGVLQPPADEEERMAKARAAVLDLVEKACDRLMQMREHEGRAIHEDLSSQASEISGRLERVAALAPGVIEEYEKRLRARIQAMVADAGLKIEPSDLIREIAVYAERTDIAEEVTRLRAHLKQFGEMLSDNGGKPIGRTMDFLAQEMLREANTIASKSPDAEIAGLIVEVKGAIDRIKEQAANVE